MGDVVPMDPSWRVGAVFRACVRYGMDRDWAETKLAEQIGASSAQKLCGIWFRKDPISGPASGPPPGYKLSVIERARNAYAENYRSVEPVAPEMFF